MDLHNLAKKENKITSGHRLCSGCGAGIVINQTMLAAEDENVVVINATGCVEVTTTIYPNTAWNIPWIHCALENSASTAAGVETAYKALKKKGKIKDNIKFIVFSGDGGTYDIGLQALSGMLERGHNILYICYNNEANMNTGYQRSGATPLHAETTTRPWGKNIHGNPTKRKNLTKIIEAHGIPFVAQAATAYHLDFMQKVKLGLATEGPAFIDVLSTCRLGWGHPSNMACQLSKLAVETCYWPIYEIRNGRLRLNYRPKEPKPLEDFIQFQKRFEHLLLPENKKELEDLKRMVSDEWQALVKREDCDRVCMKFSKGY
ncbi:MAG: thiamine pyrophosphate-dependent enzyme [Candidatus Berkelbacteria bacterium]|nr:thiamine pyrophosphate-dependent enzyme [Candidatus Berkelbacteria bacterium]